MAPPTTIRPARVEERASLEALQWRASLANPADRDHLLAHPDAIDLPADQIARGLVFVAERDGAVVGFAALLPRHDGDVELDGLFVEPGRWRGGVGRALVEHVVAVAAAMGAAVLHVVGNPDAIGFYESCRFVRVGTFQTRFAPAPLMARPLR